MRRGDGDVDGSPTTLKWGFGPGIPTPDPIFLKGTAPGVPKWNYGPGIPTPDPIFLTLPDRGSPTTLKWNYGPGVPTPDPVLLVEVAGGHADGTSPTTLKLDFQWGGTEEGDGPPSPNSLKWNYPPGVPTPDPALLVEVAPPGSAPVTPTAAGGVEPPSVLGMEVSPPGTPGGPPVANAPPITNAPAGVDKGSPTTLILKWSEFFAFF